MAMLGTPGVPVMANDDLIRTTPNDTAYVVSATSSMTDVTSSAPTAWPPTASSRPTAAACGSATTSSSRAPTPTWTRAATPPAGAGRAGAARQRQGRALHAPAGRCTTTGACCAGPGGASCTSGTSTDVSGLCTLEYACGTSPQSLTDRRLPGWLHVPARFFTYHVLDVDDETQLLFTHVLGPGGLRIKSAVYERSLGRARPVLTFGHVWAVHEYDEQPLTTPDGRAMRMPQALLVARGRRRPPRGRAHRRHRARRLGLRPRRRLRRHLRLHRLLPRPRDRGRGATSSTSTCR